MPVSGKRVTQLKIYRISSKVNQFIYILYILVCNYMPNIRILALAVLQIFCSQGCSYIIKKGVTQLKIYRISSKVNQFIYILYILVCNYMPNIRILALAVLQIFCSQGCSYIIKKGAYLQNDKTGGGKNNKTCHRDRIACPSHKKL